MYLDPIIKGALRNAWRKANVRKEIMLAALHPTARGERGGRRYICAKCGENFAYSEVQVDHIEPVIPTNREIKDWNEYISRLYCTIEELQVLCKSCHQEKSNEENTERRI